MIQDPDLPSVIDEDAHHSIPPDPAPKDIPTDDDYIPSEEELQADASPFTDAANADAVFKTYPRNKFLFVSEWDSWIAWDSKRWRLSGGKAGAKNALSASVIRVARERSYRAKGVLKDLEAQLLKVMDPLSDLKFTLEGRIKFQKKLIAHFDASQNGPKINACIAILQSLLIIQLADLDKSPWLFNVANGTIDLTKGQLREHRREDLITQISDIEYNARATAPVWQAFLATAMAGSHLMTHYLQRVVGYELTGSVREQCLFFHHGPTGSNGKSTFRGTIHHLLGEYACTGARQLLSAQQNGAPAHPAELARLYGKRFVGCAEVGENDQLDEAKVKDLTGGDIIACRKMNENFWDLLPTHKLDLFGNHRPNIRGTDNGIWRRIKLIPWLVTISDDQKDKDLPAKLRAELPGILNWAVYGCLEWQREGLNEPKEVVDAVGAYKSDSDVLGAFLKDYAIFKTEESCGRKDFRMKYELWCEESGHHPVGARKLGERLRSYGVKECNLRKGLRIVNSWQGVNLRSDEEFNVDGTVTISDNEDEFN